MSTLYPLPDVARVNMLLGMLYEGLQVKPGAPVSAIPRCGSYFAVFVSDEGRPVALCGCDIELAASSSGALSMLPVATIKDAVKSKVLTDVMLANLSEVMNISTRLLITDGSHHLKLQSLYAAENLPPDALAVLTGSKGRADFSISINKYGSGNMSIISV